MQNDIAIVEFSQIQNSSIIITRESHSKRTIVLTGAVIQITNSLVYPVALGKLWVSSNGLDSLLNVFRQIIIMDSVVK